MMMAKKELTLKFDHHLDFQLEAIQAVADLFKGLPRFDSAYALGERVVPNLPASEWLSESALLENLNAVQRKEVEDLDDARRGSAPFITPNAELDVDEGLVLEGAGSESWRYPSFTVEMETGTGKTYVYLRTIFELRRQYGFRKFIIVVPSVAIYEGVVKSFETITPHFRSTYGNENVHLIRYDGGHLSDLRTFSDSSFVEVMVMTLQSFNKASGRTRNTIYRPSEDLPGERLPFQYIQETRPILILDEPQNMESQLSREALRTLHPLFALRYSATHREVHNLVHVLTPFEAYQRGLVKKIQVDGVFEQQELDPGTVLLREISTSPLRAVVAALANIDGQSRPIEVTLTKGDNLFTKTHRDEHRHGFVVDEISAKTSDTFIAFNGGTRLSMDDIFSHSRRAIFKIQIERTVERHLRTQEDLLARGIKVLSLFFIDRVANYVNDDGLIKTLFDEAFEKHKEKFPHFKKWEAAQVRNGYFARAKPAKGENEGKAIDTTGRNQAERDAEKEAFRLIMREKERLLSLEEPVSFIFAHSALKEGWDNPNVFQICTLNQTVSEMKKRQEIGRGLRLPVNQDGERIFDDTVNVLTVIANESYEGYAGRLQSEYREAGYDKLPPKPTRIGTQTAHRNDDVFENAEFRKFWGELSRRSRYSIHVDSADLIDDIVLRFNALERSRLDPKIVIERGLFVITKFTIRLLAVAGQRAQIEMRRISTERQMLPEDVNTQTYQPGNSLQRELNEPRLRGYRISEIGGEGELGFVIFENDVKLFVGEESTFESEQGQKPLTRSVEAPVSAGRIINLIDRAARESGLTRKSVFEVYKRIRRDYKEIFIRNPEGFTNLFIAAIKECLANHIVKNLEFTFDAGTVAENEIEAFFPPEKDFPQKELVEAGQAGMYDRVQVDSIIEENFVRNHLSGNDPNVVGYFKFPPAYKVDLPRVIGNYNPDWGILRWNKDKQLVLRLVRETKGGEDPERLRFSNEGRKVAAAQKHFNAIHVDYRMVTDVTPEWYQPYNYHELMEPKLPYDKGEEE